MDWKLELVPVPVTDVDRAKAFYVDQVGFNADHDHRVNDQLRFVQLTPPGSACSIAIGHGHHRPRRPARVQGLQMVVADIEAARAELVEPGRRGHRGRRTSPWGRFVFFSDPDGNGWAVQEIGPGSAGARPDSGTAGNPPRRWRGAWREHHRIDLEPGHDPGAGGDGARDVRHRQRLHRPQRRHPEARGRPRHRHHHRPVGDQRLRPRVRRAHRDRRPARRPLRPQAHLPDRRRHASPPSRSSAASCRTSVCSSPAGRSWGSAARSCGPPSSE